MVAISRSGAELCFKRKGDENDGHTKSVVLIYIKMLFYNVL